MALADEFYVDYMIKYDLHCLTGSTIPIRIITDSPSLLYVITKATVTTKNILMIDLKTINESYHKQEIMDFGFIRSHFNPVDALTKVMKNHILEHMLIQSKIEHSIEQ